MLKPSPHRTSFSLLLIVLISGCNSSDPMLPVDGTVKYSDGQPVTGELATIVFQTDGASANIPVKSASGTIDSDGSFQLMTDKPGDGAHPGDYKVVLKVWQNYREQKLAIPERYSQMATTPLKATVDRDNTTIEFVVDR